MNIIECIDTRFFKLLRNTHAYCLEQSYQGHMCQIINTERGYFVNVFTEFRK